MNFLVRVLLRCLYIFPTQRLPSLLSFSAPCARDLDAALPALCTHLLAERRLRRLDLGANELGLFCDDPSSLSSSSASSSSSSHADANTGTAGGISSSSSISGSSSSSSAYSDSSTPDGNRGGGHDGHQHDGGVVTATLFARLPFCTSLTHLHLDDNALGDAGAARVAAILSVSVSLLKVSVRFGFCNQCRECHLN
jgi:hypothetical protein